jgi:hypothetical protein
MKWRLLCSGRALCSVLVSFVYAIGASAQTLTLQRNAVSSALVSIAQERSWDRSTCEPRTVAVNILDQPANGTVTIREETSRIPATTPKGGSTGPRSGREIIGKQLYYQSKPGFVGADRIVYATTYGGSQTEQTTINVTITNQPMPPPPSQVPRPVSYRTVTSGLATDIGSVTRWGLSCEPLPPTLIIVEAPQHGVTTVRDEPAAIPARDSEGNLVSCVGRVIVRKALYYQSQPGFQGTDHLVYDTEHGRYAVEITVSAGSSR